MKKSAVLLFSAAFAAAVPAHKTWTGAEDNLASNPANWQPAGVPAAADTIVLGPGSAEDLLWDFENGAPGAVAQWRQEKGYAGTVIFPTTYGAGFPVFTITGDAEIMDGKWTHPANGGDAVHRLNVAVGGAMTLGAGAVIDVFERGYAGEKGPGYFPGLNFGGGAAMAGEGWGENNRIPTTRTYGFVRAPGAPGSGAVHNPGAGAVRLSVAGHFQLDGAILADGSGQQDKGGSSGGSVWVDAATIGGAGLVSANGGEYTGHGSGGGGRVAIVSASPLPGGITARARGAATEWRATGAGTVFFGKPGGGAGDVVVDNGEHGIRIGAVYATHLPARLPGFENEDLSRTCWRVSHNAKVTMQSSAQLSGMEIGATSALDLNGFVLSAGKFEIYGAAAFPPGVYTAADIGSPLVTGAGYVAVGGFGVVENRESELADGNAVLRAEVLAAGANPVLRIYYGETDGGDDPAAWDFVHKFPAPAAVGAVCHAIALPTGKRLVYRYAAGDGSKVFWAPESTSIPLVEVNVAAVSPHADKSTGAAGRFKITRSAGADALPPAAVNIILSGTAVNGADYKLVRSPVTIPAGEDFVMVDIVPAGRWNTNALHATLTVAPGMYLPGARQAGTVAFEALPLPDGPNIFLGGDPLSGESWSAGRSPGGSDHVMVAGWANGNDLHWGADMADSVASWTQRGYDGTVVFGTTFDPLGFPVFTIAGDVVLEDGVWTHRPHDERDGDNNHIIPGNEAAYRLRVRVGGDMLLGSNAAVNLQRRGFRAANGPGFPGNGNYGGGSAMGGEASGGFRDHYGADFHGATCNLVRTPYLPGSGTPRESGVGALWLEVDGTLTLDGAINAGGTANSVDNHGGTSGGSVYLKAAAVTGAGSVNADGGRNGHGSGSGGRIALISASPLPGKLVLSAFGNDASDRGFLSGAGTIFLGGTDGLHGAVIVDNPPSERIILSTQLPSNRIEDQSENLRLTDWIVTRHGKVKVRADTRVNSFILSGSAIPTALDLAGRTLTLVQYSENGGVNFARPGAYEDNESGMFNRVAFNGGTIVVVDFWE